jgi:TRAP-type mannitol/chloroaromatic compound transport system permease small subunit
MESTRLGSVSIDSQTLTWPIQALLPVGFGLLALELLMQLIEAVAGKPE